MAAHEEWADRGPAMCEEDAWFMRGAEAVEARIAALRARDGGGA